MWSPMATCCISALPIDDNPRTGFGGVLTHEAAMTDLIAFEDFIPGEITTYGAHTVTREEIIAYASRYDAQPMHLDEEAGRASVLGGLAASGWHSCAILMRLNCDHFITASTSMGGPGIDELKWLKPVYPGDVLSVRREVLDARASRSRPDMGIVRFRFELLNQKGDVVMEQVNPVLFGRRSSMGAP